MRKMLPVILIFCCSAVFAQRDTNERTADNSGVKLYFKKTNKEVTTKRQKKVSRTLAHPKEKDKTLPMTVEYIDLQTADLQIVSEEIDAANWMWKVSIANKGNKKSNEAYYAYHINYVVSTYQPGNPLSPFKTTSSIVYQDGKVIPELAPGNQYTVFFDLSKSGTTYGKPLTAAEKAWKEIFGNIKTTTSSSYYTISTYFVTEPIVAK